MRGIVNIKQKSSKVRIVLTSGIPASGKTTWSKNMEKLGWIRVSTDDIRGEIFGEKANVFDYDQNMKVWEVFTEKVRKEAKPLNSTDKKGIICDCMALSINFIGFLYENIVEILLNDNEILPEMEIKYFHISPEVARARIEKALANREKRANISLEMLRKYKTIQDRLFQEEFYKEWLEDRGIEKFEEKTEEL